LGEKVLWEVGRVENVVMVGVVGMLKGWKVAMLIDEKMLNFSGLLPAAKF